MSDTFNPNNPNDPEKRFNTSGESPLGQQNGTEDSNFQAEPRFNWNFNAKDYAKKQRSRWLKRFCFVLSIIVAIGVLGLAGIGVYYIYNQYTQNHSQSENSDVSNSSDGLLTIQQGPEDTETAGLGELTTEQVYKKVGPSVVGIVSTIQSGYRTAEGTGSGIILSSDGYIITNAHVVEGASKVTVYLSDGTKYDAKIVGADSKTDLAVIKIGVSNLMPAVFGDSDKIEVGSRAIAIGSPYSIEFAGTVTQGVISAINRDIEIEGRSMCLLQTDASINPGNSGGPLINKYGQVIGINSLKIASSQFQGMGFAIPINSAQPIINDLVKVGYVRGRPLLGIQGADVGNDMRSMLYGDIQGVEVVSIDEKSKADEAGLKVGDIIVKVDGQVIKNMKELNLKKDTHSAGDTINLTVYRDNKLIDIKVELIEYVPDAAK